MKSKTFVILLALCAVLGIATWMVSTSGKNSGKKQSSTEDSFLSQLPVNEIVSIFVKDAENEVLLEKGESVWQVKNRFGYPADFGKIIEFAKKLKESKVGRTFEATADARERLALYSPEEKDIKKESKGTRVTLKDKAGKTLADVIIGKPREGSTGFGGHYLMTAGGKTVYLVDKDWLYLDKKPSDWVQTDLLDVKTDEVREVVCTDSKNGTVVYTLRRPEKGKDLELLNVPEGKKIVPSKLNNAASALAGFKIEDVADPAAKVEDTGTDSLCLTFRMFDGTEYSACPGKASKEDPEKYYVRVSAAYKEPEKPAEKKAEESAPAATEGKSPEIGDKTGAAPENRQEEKTDIAKDAVVAENFDKPLVVPADKDSSEDKAQEAKPEEKPAVPDKQEDKTAQTGKEAGAEKAKDAPVPAGKEAGAEKAKDTTKDTKDTKPEEKPDPAKLAADAAELNKKIRAWTYLIPKWKAERLITNMEDFFEKPKPEGKAEGGAPANLPAGMPMPGVPPFQPAQ